MTVKFSLTLEDDVYEALSKDAADAMRDPKEHMREILNDAAATSGYMPEHIAADLQLFRDLSENAVNEAQRITAELGLQPDITLRAFQACQQNPQWLEDYRRYIGDNEFAENNERKSRLNKYIGKRVKRALNAQAETVGDNKSVMVPVKGEIIKSYTRLKP